MTTIKLYQKMAQIVSAANSCNDEFAAKHKEYLRKLVREHMPSGSGCDAGTDLNIESSTHNKLVFGVSFHHMNEHGSYDGWTEHKVIVRPSLAFGCEIKVTGRDRNDIKNYIGDLFFHALETEVAL